MKGQFAQRTDWTASPNPLTQKLSELRGKGASVLDLTVSNPTHCGFQYLSEEILKPLTDPKNLVYDPDAHGILAARQAVVSYYAKKGVELSPDQIFLTASTSEAYSFVFRLLMEPGDSILAPQPSYPLLEYLCQMNNVELLRYPLVYRNGWKIDFDSGDSHFFNKKVTVTYPQPKPKAVLFVHPNNPSGNFIKNKEYFQIQKGCYLAPFCFVADEVFLDFKLTETGDRPKSDLSPVSTFAATNDVLTFTLSGISKILGLPQMKISWIVVTGPAAERNEAIRRLEIISDTYLSANTPSQQALSFWFEKMPAIQGEILKRLRTNYQHLEKNILPSRNVRLLRSEGGWNAVLEFPQAASDEDLALDLLEKRHILLHPGYLFDFPAGNFLAASLLISPQIFREGMNRIFL